MSPLLGPACTASGLFSPGVAAAAPPAADTAAPGTNVLVRLPISAANCLPFLPLNILAAASRSYMGGLGIYLRTNIWTLTSRSVKPLYTNSRRTFRQE